MAELENLIGAAEKDYGDDYRKHILEQYKLFVDMMNKISERRHNANTFFLTINSALITLMGITWPDPASKDRLSTPNLVWHIIVGMCGVLLSAYWLSLIRSYKDLNAAKFRVINAIERLLPVRPYDAEWAALGHGRKDWLYIPFTQTELRIPWVFMFLHAAYTVILTIFYF